ncbi:hypothetical protein HK099_004148 [Clydaea vesicula]|uniref:2,4-dienoyl-CoA reductase [(3E)-enoyl-CoA-producing] n=1 Tax=Clydaea vesicula TaxID=447962 RepID=A0AAD5XYD5_9FUNG|nr:hypothetical protein HK099_004148 [Clydaea vesicula]
MTLNVFSHKLLEGKIAFITGGGSGICKGITESFMRHGANVAITSRNLQKLEKAATELEGKTGKSCLPIKADVRDFESVKKAVESVIEKYGRLDILICGAAGNFLSPAAALSSNAFKTVIEIDLIGTFHTCKAAFPFLKHSKGNIISISATLHYTGTPLQAHAVAAKAGVDGLTKTLAVEWGQYGIRVNAIGKSYFFPFFDNNTILAPGPIEDTEGFRKLSPPKEILNGKKEITGVGPLNTFGKIQDIEYAALYLASEAGRYVSGNILVVDGATWLGY